MSRADDLARRAARVTEHATRLDPGEATPAPSRPGPAPRVKDVRITVDLPPARHRWLRRWCADTAEELEKPLVHASDVVRALLAELDADPDLAGRVRDRLRH